MLCPSPEFRTHLCAVVEEVFRTGFEDWEQMVGATASFKAAQVRVLPENGGLLTRIVKQDVFVVTRIEGVESAPAYFVFPDEFVAYAVARAMMMPEGDHPSVDREDEDEVGAAKELMNLFCGAATRALAETEHGSMHFSQSVNHLDVLFGSEKVPAGEKGGQWVCTCVEFEARGKEHRAWCILMPRTVDQLSRQFGRAA